MFKTYTIACIASVGLALNAKLADMLASRSIPLGAPGNAKILSLAHSKSTETLETDTKLAQVANKTKAKDGPPVVEERDYGIGLAQTGAAT